MEQLTQEEIDERVAVLRRFKSLLTEQRNKFREYLEVLEKQQDSISTEDTSTLLVHTELEEQIVKNIANLQKVIVPMSELYKTSRSGTLEKAEQQNSIPQLQGELDDLQQQVLAQNKKNRELLQVHLTDVRTKLDSLQNPYRNKHSVYAQKKPVGTLIEVEA